MPSLATWFTPSLQTISRSSGRSSVLAAAYRACMELTDERLGITRDFTPKGKHGLAGNFCVGIPNDDIGLLFNSAEKAETRVNSTVARELMLPLPSAWTDEQRALCARGMGEMLRARYGVAVLVSIHRPSKDNNNYHAHILFTTRTVDADGNFGKKTRILDDAKTGEVKKLREVVCELVNAQAKEQGEDWYVYAGKFADVLEDHLPTKHISIAHGKNQKAYIDTNRQEVKEAREEIQKTKKEIKIIDAKIAALQTQPLIAESSHYVARVPKESDKGVVEPKPTIVQLKPIAMHPDAEKAFIKIQHATNAHNEARKESENWQKRKSKLEQNRPHFFKRLFSNYEEKLDEAKTKVLEFKALGQVHANTLKDPETLRLSNVYTATLAHNVKADELQKENAMRIEHERQERERFELEQERQREIRNAGSASRDFLTSIHEEEEKEKNRLVHANAAIKKILSDNTVVPNGETKTQRALRLHSVWATYEHHEKRIRDCLESISAQYRIIDKLHNDKPSFWQSEAKEKHKQSLFKAHAMIMGLEVVCEQSKTYRANKQIRVMQAEFCGNLEYRQIVKDCAAQIPVFNGVAAEVKNVLTYNPQLKKEAWAKCEEVLHI